MKYNIQYKGILIFIAVMTAVFGLYGFNFNTAKAVINKQINYQGKLFTGTNTPVSDGGYNVKYRLYTTATGGSPIWTETLCYSSDNGNTCDGTGTDNRVSVSNGLFSTMLGSVTSLDAVNFNQTLYLGVEIGGNSASSATWDGEMTPRKKIGAVPAAFEADKLDGLSSEQFIRSDADNATTSSSTFLNVIQNGAGKVAEFIGQSSASVLSILSDGKVGIGTTTPTDVLSVNGPIYLANTSPVSTANRIYANGGSLYYAGNLIGGATVGNWTSNGTDVWRPTGTVGVGTSTPFANFAINPDVGSASNQFVIGSSTATNFIVDNSGNIGVGTASPGAKLHITSTGSPLEALRLQNTTASQSVDMTFYAKDSGNSNRERARIKADTGNTTADGKLTFQVLRNLSEVDALTMIGGVSTSEAFVGIGSSTPYAKLSVTNLGVNHSFVVEDSASPDTTPFVIDNAGLVGIGTTSPSTSLHIDSGSASLPSITLSAAGGSVQTIGRASASFTGGAAATDLGIRYSNKLWLGNSSTASMVVDSSGNVGIGTSTINTLTRLALDGTSTSGTWQSISNGSAGGKNYWIGSTGSSNGSGTGKFAIYDVDNAAYRFILDGSGNVGIGTSTPGQKISVAGDILGNNFIGSYFTGTSTTVSTFNGPLNTSGTTGGYRIDNTLILQASSTNFSTLLGQSAGAATLADGLYNTAIGYQALMTATSTDGNTGVGYQALKANTVGANNTALGYISLAANTTGSSNTAVGYRSLRNNTTGDFNTALGTYALDINTTGGYNTSIGFATLTSNTTGNYNTANGYEALLYNTTGSSNTASGYFSLAANTTGNSNTVSGHNSMSNNITGSENTSIGYGSLRFNQSATSSTAFGFAAGYGAGAPYSNQGGVYIGHTSGYSAMNGSDYNTLIGYKSGYGITTGARNVFLGNSTIAASYNQVTTGSNNISIGNDVAVPSATANNQLSIGNLIYGSGLDGTGATVSSGYIGIGSSTPYAKLSITNTDTNPSFIVEDSTSPDSTPFIIDANGNVGIGTTTPGQKLEVMGIGRFDGTNTFSIGSDTNYNRIDTAGSGSEIFRFLSSGNNMAGIRAGSMVIGTAAPFLTATAPTQGLIVQGNVGIGTTSPLARLDVAGANNGTSPLFQVSSVSSFATTTRFIVDSSGNVGIGTTTPRTIFDIASASAPTLSISNTTNGTWAIGDILGALDFYSSDVNDNFPGVASKISSVIETDTGGSNVGLALSTASIGTLSEKLRISSAGYVGIGTTTPISRLQITEIGTSTITLHRSDTSVTAGQGIGSIDFASNDSQLTGGFSTGAYMRAYAASALTTSYPTLNLAWGVTSGTSAASDAMTLSSSGNLGIGTTTPTTLLQVTSASESIISTNRNAGVADGTDIGSLRFMNLQNYNAGIQALASGTNEDAAHLRFMTSPSGGSVLERLRITSDGYVGIGTTTPALQEGGASGDKVLVVSSIGTTNRAADIELAGFSNSAGIGNAAGRLTFTRSGDALARIAGYRTAAATDAGQLSFLTAASGANLTEKMVIDPSGLVGIGTSTPYATLSVTNTQANPSFVVEDSTSPDVSPFIIDASGNVGVGTTTTSSYNFNVHGTSNFVGSVYIHPLADPTNTSRGIVLTGNTFNADNTIGAYNNSGAKFIIQSHNTGIGTSTASITMAPDSRFISFSTATSTATGSLGAWTNERMRLDGSGNLGIGTTTPFAKLSVTNTGSDPSFVVEDSTSPDTTPFIIDASGKVGIGTSTPSNALDVYSGNVVVRSGNEIRAYDTTNVMTLQISQISTDARFANGYGQINLAASTNINLQTFYNSQYNTDFTLQNGGKIGISTTSPYSQLSVGGKSVSTTLFALDALSGQTAPILDVKLASTSKFMVDASGNVGIGTTSPVTKLHVMDTGAGTFGGLSIQRSDSTTGSEAQLNFTVSTAQPTTANSNGGRISVIRQGAGAQSDMTFALTNTAGVSMPEIMRLQGSTGNVGIGSTTPYSQLSVGGKSVSTTLFALDALSGQTAPILDVKLASTSKFIVNASGNVGVGTSSPASLLHIENSNPELRLQRNNSGSAAGMISFTGNDAVTDWQIATNQAVGGAGFEINQGYQTNTRFFINSSGNVGIGTTSPVRQLTVSNSSQTYLGLENRATGGKRFDIGSEVLGGVGRFAIYDSSPGGDYRMIIDSTGNIGIGTSSPWGFFSITNTGTNPSFVVEDSTSPDTTPFIIDSAGLVGIGTSTPDQSLNIYKNGMGTTLAITGVASGNDAANGQIVFRNDNATSGTKDLASISLNTNLNTSANFGDIVFSTKSGASASSLTEYMRIKSGGNVGIGTTSPGYKLDVFGVANVGDVYGSIASPQLRINGIGGSGATSTMRASSWSNYYGDFGYSYNGSTANSSLYLNSVTNSGAGAISFRNNGVEAMRIGTNGYVGIGSTSPYASLSITNTSANPSFVVEDSTSPDGSPFIIDASGNVGIGTTSPYGVLSVINSINTTANTPLLVVASTTNGTATSTFLTVQADGKVGIGTASPTYKLEIAGGTSLSSLLNLSYKGTGSTDRNVISLSASETSGPTENGVLTIRSNATDVISFTAVPNATSYVSGNFGVGTTTGWGLLSVNPNGITGPSFVIGSSTATNFVVTNGGNVGIGTTTPGRSLEVNGSGFAQLRLQNFTNNQAGGTELYNDVSNYLKFEILGSNFATANQQNQGLIYTSNDLLFGTGGARNERMRITSGGNVGIGTTSPLSILNVSGSSPILSLGDYTGSSVTPDLRFYAGISNYSWRISHNGAVSGLEFSRSNNTGSASFNSPTFVILNTGNVGVATTSPFATFAINPTAGSASNQFVIGSSTATNFIVTNGGNVGIGTANPNSLLNLAVPSTAGTPGLLTLTNSTVTDGNGVGINFNISTNPAFINASIQAVRNSAGSGNSDLVFSTSNASSPIERLRINYLGNVGIGTTSPYATLSVVGNVVASNFSATSTTATSTFAGGVDFGSGNFTYDTYTGVTSINSLQTGNMNFETDAGQVSWADMALSSTPSDTPVGYTAFLNGSSTISVYGISAGNGWLKDDYPRVAIGSTTAPSSKLTVFGNGTGTNGTFEVVNSASTTLMKILDNGSVGIASTSPWKTFSVNGTVAMNGLTSSATGNALCITTSKEITDAGGASCTPSSIRFKENVSPMQTGYALDLLSKLSIVDFDYIEKQQYETNHSYGMIAEDVEKIDKNLVDYGYDGKPVSLHFEKITGLLVQAVQEQEGKIGDISSTTSRLDLTSSQLVASNALNITNLNSKIDVLNDMVANLNASTTLIAKLASSTADILASSTETSLLNSTSFMDKIFLSFTNYLTTAMTKVKGIFVNEIHIEDKLCVDDVCINKDQLKTLIIQATASSTNNTNNNPVNIPTVPNNNPVVTLPPATPDNGTTTQVQTNTQTQNQTQATSTTVINNDLTPAPQTTETSTTTPVTENPITAPTPVIESTPVVETTPTAPVTESAPAPAPAGESAPQS